MTTKLKNYAILIITAILLSAIVFAGVTGASEITVNATTWNSWGNDIVTPIGEKDTVIFTGDGIIYPKFNDSSSFFNPTHDITFDFTEYHGSFYGEPNPDSEYKGSLFGYIQNKTGPITITIKNLTLTSVNLTPTYPYYCYGGIVGYFNGSSPTNSKLIFMNCTLVNCSIGSSLGSGEVGGLIGFSYYASLDVRDCKAMHCDIMSCSKEVGGLVGAAISASFGGCNVANCTIMGSGSVGGLIGYACYAKFKNCEVQNTSMYASDKSGGNVGGIAGYSDTLSSADYLMQGCKVNNCVIASGGDYVGGLVGSAYFKHNGINDCCVVNCTIAGTSEVGGLVGYIYSYYHASKDNFVEYSAVKGTGANVTLVCGNGKNLDCIADLNTNFIYNGTGIGQYQDTIAMYNVTTENEKQEITLPLSDKSVKGTFWKTIFNVTGVNASSTSEFKRNVFQVTYLGKYGEIGGYGVGSAPKYSVTSGDVQNGIITPVLNQAAEGTSVTVTATPNTGYYTVNWTYYNKMNDITSSKIQFTQAFLMPAYDVTVGGDFKANVSAVVFYNESNMEIGSYINTYNAAKNFTDYVPSRPGYTPWWNVSESAVNINTYVNNGNWIFTGNNDSVLHAYVNWTENPQPTYSPSSSSKQTGSTIILSEGQVAPTAYATAAPTVAPTVKPTEQPATPTVIATEKPTTQATQQSPAPFVGLLAGLGAADILLSNRRK